MAYIGNEPAARFTSIPTVQQFNGDGSTTAFTLSRAVGSDQDILVSVDGVIQDTAAYAVSSGTTLTFSAAPSTGTANIFVNHLGLTIGSVTHPPSSALVATTGTFNSSVTSTGLIVSNNGSNGNVSAKITNTGTSTNDDAVLGFLTQGNRNYSIGIHRDSGKFTVSNLDASVSSGEIISIGNSGTVNMPLQPAFLARPASAQTNFGADGNNDTVVFGTEVFDQNADFASNTFTAPVTGKYQLSVNLYLTDLDSAANYYQATLITSNRSYFYAYDVSSTDSDPNRFTFQLTVLADMDANDTASVGVLQSGGTAQTDINVESFFSGFLAC